uniref:Glycosyltransferase family 25 n=1 Tax=Puccinia cf. psidii AE-2014 TaxID=1505670 RepID=A0A060IP25_9BASI|nr:glycosyltransferase family 25 [Puccinia cf. psidii AE-2014]
MHPSLMLSLSSKIYNLRFTYLLTLSFAAISLIVLYGWHHYSSQKLLRSFFPYAPKLDVSFFSPPSLDDSLKYRKLLELTTSPRSYNKHHPTLGFGNIYCISLPTRQDRRESMRKLAAALGINITFIDAISKEHPMIGWIGERVSEVRKQKVKLMAKYSGLKEEKFGGMGPNSVWLTSSLVTEANSARLKGIKLPNLTASHPEFQGKNWVEHLWTVPDPSMLAPSDDNFNITAALWDKQEKIAPRQLNAAAISTYYNHLRALRLLQESGAKSALILEDDVDTEWDLERRWRSLERHLPEDWETVFLGHCWGRELLNPQFGHPNLHKSSQPLCLHGYAVSQRGANKLLKLYNDPWIAFQTPVDTCIPGFIKRGLISYSVEPPIIIQSKVLESDIQSGKGSKWRGLLADSVMERILKSEGANITTTLNGAQGKDIDPASGYFFMQINTCGA